MKQNQASDEAPRLHFLHIRVFFDEKRCNEKRPTFQGGALEWWVGVVWGPNRVGLLGGCESENEFDELQMFGKLSLIHPYT